MSTLANAIDVLKLIVRLRRDITMSDLVSELGCPKSSASRTLTQMAEHGFLERHPATKAYRPGLVIIEASSHLRASSNLLNLLEAALEGLVQESGFTGYISTLKGPDTLAVQMRPGSKPLQIYTPPGSIGPSFASSMGRALLARLPDKEVVALVGDLGDAAKYGSAPATIEDLMARIARARIDGWAESHGEVLPYVAGISSAVSEPATGLIYGLGIAMPIHSVSDELFARIAQQVKEAARLVGRRIGDLYWMQFGEGLGAT